MLPHKTLVIHKRFRYLVTQREGGFSSIVEVHGSNVFDFYRACADRTTKAATCRAVVYSGQRSVQQSAERCYLVSKQAAVCGTEDSCAGRAVAAGVACAT